MAVYEHTRLYKVAKVVDGAARLEAPVGRKYWEMWLTQNMAKQLFKRKLKKGDTVLFKRSSGRTWTWYSPVALVK